MNGDTILLATRKGMLVFSRASGSWRFAAEHFPGVTTSYAARLPSGDLWTCLDHGHWGAKLQRSRDAGNTWEEAPAPKYPEDAVRSDGKPATLKYQWVLAPGGADEPATVYIGTEPGGLFRSDDRGDSFQLVEGLWNHPSRMAKEGEFGTGWFGGGREHPGIHSVLVDPRDSRHVYVGISCAGVFETRDRGESWTTANKGLKAEFLPNPDSEVGHDPHLVVASPTKPDVMWQQNHCGIFRSTDGAASWTSVAEEGGPARFGFAISVDPKNPGVSWVVPAEADEVRAAVDRKLCVCRTDDGGKTWQTFRKGLPQEQCFDIALRHALDLSGDRLAFGTTTGNVYVSEDRGESWQCLGNNLPPVYSVRFA